MGLPAGMIAGAVISGAYFGDKLSPLSDTTNLAAAMAGSELFTHIRYALYNLTYYYNNLIYFCNVWVNFFLLRRNRYLEFKKCDCRKIQYQCLAFSCSSVASNNDYKKNPPLIALSLGSLLGAFFALIFSQTYLFSWREVKHSILRSLSKVY